MSFLFSRKTPQEQLRQNQRALTKAQRDLDRERTKLQQQEKKLITDIKKAAQNSQMNSCKIMAKDLIKTRKQIDKFYAMKTQLQGVSLKIVSLQSTTQMSQSMKEITKAMKQMNNRMKLPQIQKIMQEFEQQSEIMDLKEEIISDQLDEAEEDDEVESEEIVQQVLDEIGISTAQSMPAAQVSAAQPEQASGEDDLMARLQNLRKE